MHIERYYDGDAGDSSEPAELSSKFIDFIITPDPIDEQEVILDALRWYTWHPSDTVPDSTRTYLFIVNLLIQARPDERNSYILTSDQVATLGHLLVAYANYAPTQFDGLAIQLADQLYDTVTIHDAEDLATGIPPDWRETG